MEKLETHDAMPLYYMEYHTQDTTFIGSSQACPPCAVNDREAPPGHCALGTCGSTAITRQQQGKVTLAIKHETWPNCTQTGHVHHCHIITK